MLLILLLLNRGSFELWETGSLPEFCDGLQGHISCSASPELHEVAKKFPSKILVHVLPRQTVWPSEFQENYATCDSIDIFFSLLEMLRGWSLENSFFSSICQILQTLNLIFLIFCSLL
jgi:hypothetical protein